MVTIYSRSLLPYTNNQLHFLADTIDDIAIFCNNIFLKLVVAVFFRSVHIIGILEHK